MADVPHPRRCPSCGAGHRGGLAGSGLCPSCLLKLALDAGDVSLDEAETGSIGPSYRVLTILEEEPGRTVYLAEQSSGRQLVALDVAAAPGGASGVGEFRSRLAALQRLDDPRIARVVDARVAPDGSLCTVSRYAGAPRISRFCDGHGLSAPERCALFEDLCGAIAYAHARGVVHGRLRPDTVAVVGGPGAARPLITGFGMWTDHAPEVADDLAGLAAIAKSMGGPEVDAGGCTTVPALRDAVRAAWTAPVRSGR